MRLFCTCRRSFTTSIGTQRIQEKHSAIIPADKSTKKEGGGGEEEEEDEDEDDDDEEDEGAEEEEEERGWVDLEEANADDNVFLANSYEVKYRHEAGAEPMNVIPNPLYKPRRPSFLYVFAKQSINDEYFKEEEEALMSFGVEVEVVNDELLVSMDVDVGVDTLPLRDC